MTQSVVSVMGFDPEESNTVTGKIDATVTKAVEELGEKEVTPEVIQANKELSEACKPLAFKSEFTFDQKRQVDAATDKTGYRIRNTCQDIVDSYDQEVVPLTPAQEEESEAAELILDTVISDGMSYLSGSWFRQYGGLAMLFALIDHKDRADIRRAIRILGLTNRFELLRSLYKVYGVRMGFSVDQMAQATALDAWHQALEHYLSAVTFKHRADSPLRERLLRPYLESVEEIRPANRSKSAARSKDRGAKPPPEDLPKPDETTPTPE